MLNGLLSKVLEELYKLDSMKSLKGYLRPLKHFVFGKSDIYKWIHQISKARGGNGLKIIFDVGAAVGDKTIVFLQKFPQANLYCFEPLSSSHRHLAKRISPYKNRVKLFRFGLYNRNCELPFKVASYRDASSILPLQGLENKEIKEIGEEKVLMCRLDDFVDKINIDRIDLIKIDVEGVEKEVIEGGIWSLRNKVDNVIIEICPLRKGAFSADHIKVFQYLHDAGFAFIGCDVDYFFSKDNNVLKMYFNPSKK